MCRGGGPAARRDPRCPAAGRGGTAGAVPPGGSVGRRMASCGAVTVEGDVVLGHRGVVDCSTPGVRQAVSPRQEADELEVALGPLRSRLLSSGWQCHCRIPAIPPKKKREKNTTSRQTCKLKIFLKYLNCQLSEFHIKIKPSYLV